MKRFLSVLTVIAIMMSGMCIFALAAQTIPEERLLPRLNDEAEIIPDEAEDTILGLLDRKSEQYQIDIVVATVDTTNGQDVQDAADDYFDYNGFGYGESADGVILFISMNPRTVHVGTCGVGIDMFYPDGIIDEIYDELKSGDFKNACYEFVEEVEEEIEYYRENGYSEDLKYEYDNYYSGYTDEDDLAENLIKGAVVALIIGFIFSAVKISSMKKKMNTVALKQQASDYYVENSMQLYANEDHFVYKDIRRTPIPQQSSSSSHSSGSHSSHSSHTSSSGRSHGGSSRGF